MFLRKIIFKPKKNDGSMSSQFFYADEELTAITDELDSFDGHKEPERCTQLVNKLRSSQDKLLVIVDSILHEELGPHCATSRDFRVKFPDDVLQEGLRGQLWFGAECLAAGSSILNREPESNCMRPLAKAMTMKLAKLRKSLRDQCLKNGPLITERIQEDLIIFDRLFADFELSYVSAMVHIKSIKEYDRMQDVIVLFSETTQRALKKGLLTQDMLDDYDPALMFTIPRLAIVCGLLTYPDGPLNPDMDPIDMSDMFRPFQTLMYKIRELLCTLSEEELAMLEKSLCSTDEVTPVIYQRSLSTSSTQSNKQAKTLSQQAQSAAKAAASAGDTRPVGVSSVDMTSAVYDTADSHHHQASRDSNAGMVTAESSVMSSPDLALLATASSSDNVAGSEVCDVDICGVDGITCLRHSKSWPNTQTSGAAMHDTVSVQHDSEDTPVCSGGVCSRCDSMECVCTSRAYRNIPNTHATVVTASSSSQRHRMSGDAVIPDDASSSGDEELDANVPQMLGELLDTDTELPCDSRSQFEQSLEQIQQRTCDTTSNSDIVTTTSTTHSNDSTVISNNNNTSSTGSNNSELSSGMKILEDSLSSEPGDKIDMSVCDIVHVHAAAAAAVHAADTTTTSSVDEDSSGIRSGQDSQHGVINAGQHHHRSATEVGVEEHKADVVLQEIGSLQITDRFPERKDDDQRSVTSSAGDDSKEQSRRNPAEEEITVAIQEAELAARREARSRYKSSADMMHRLFVCISGVADQLQTNYAADLRQILKVVFECNSGDDDDVDMSITAHVAAGGNGSTRGDAQQGDDEGDDSDVIEATEDIVDASMGVSGTGERYHEEDYITSTGTDAVAGDGGAVTEQEVPHRRTAPAWVPDEAVLQCTSCTAPFTFVRRRHHCRNCGKIFCGRCSSNYVSLPHFGHDKPVRVCMHCYTFEVTPFTAST